MATTRRKQSRPGASKGVACIVVIYGPDLGRRAALTRSAFEIGRSSRCELPIDQESVSRHHARIWFSSGAHIIEDLGSTNGTFVGDERVEGRRALRHGDQIRVGRSILKYLSGDALEQNYHEEIYRLMTVDALTQTYNKRYFGEALERECSRSNRYKRDLSLVVFDVDRFKDLSDANGHVAMDSVLRELALAIKPKLRAQDIFARLGSEQFAVLLPEVPLAGARVTAEKIRKIAEAVVVGYREKTILCTVSLGIAVLGDGAETSEKLVQSAEARLTQARGAGGNTVTG